MTYPIMYGGLHNHRLIVKKFLYEKRADEMINIENREKHLSNYDSRIIENQQHIDTFEFWKFIYDNTIKNFNNDYDYPKEGEDKREKLKNYKYDKKGYHIFTGSFFDQYGYMPLTKIYEQICNPNLWNLNKFSLMVKNQIFEDSQKNLNIFYSFFEKFKKRIVWRNRPVYVQQISIPENSKIAIIGDIHSSFHTLIDIIEDIKHFFEKDFKLLPNHYIFFVGDIVDRGPYSIETLLLVSRLKIVNENNVYIICGNHENKFTYKSHGTAYEVNSQFHSSYHEMFDKFMLSFPSCIFVKTSNKIYQFNHGAFDHIYGGFDDDGNNIESQLDIFLKSNKQYDLILGKAFDTDFCAKEYDKYHGTNNYIWGFFNMEVISIKHFNDKLNFNNNRDDDIKIYGLDITKKYMKRHNISCMFGGHQDEENFGIFSKDKPNEKYQLGDDEHKFWILQDDTDEIILNKNIYAVITSTATIPKKLDKNCYCILEI